MGFELSFAGIPFSVDDPEILAWIDREMPLRQELFGLPSPNPWNGKNLHGLLGDTLPPYPPLRIGDWFYPWGARRWSVFNGLATQDQVKQMMAAALPGGSPITQQFIMQADVTGNPQVEGLSWKLQTQMWMLPPRVLACHLPGTSLEGVPLYLVTLVDTRYFFPQRAAVNSDWHFGGGTVTWANLLNDLQTALNINLTWPAVNAVYGSPEPDSDLYSNFENPAALLDAIAANLGSVLVRNMDGTYQLLPHANGAAGADSVTLVKNSRLSPVQRTAGGNMMSQPQIGPDESAGPNAETAAIPSAVQVTFPKFQTPGGMGTTTGNWMAPRPSSTWIQDSYGDVWVENVTAAQAGVANPNGITNNTWTLHDTCKALYYTGNEAQPVNEAALRSLAVQMATDFYNGAIMGLDETYPGIVPWLLEGLHDVLWSFRGATGQALTRVIPRPWNYGPLEFQHELNPGLTQTNDGGFWGKILSGSNPYAWKQEDVAANGTWTDTVNGLSGTTTHDPAYELNANKQVSAGTIVRIYKGFQNPDPTDLDYRFANAGTGIKVEYDDSSVVINPCDDLQVAILDFVLSNPSAGVAKLRTRGVTQTLTVVVSVVCTNGQVVVMAVDLTIQDGLIQAVSAPYQLFP